VEVLGARAIHWDSERLGISVRGNGDLQHEPVRERRGARPRTQFRASQSTVVPGLVSNGRRIDQLAVVWRRWWNVFGEQAGFESHPHPRYDRRALGRGKVMRKPLVAVVFSVLIVLAASTNAGATILQQQPKHEKPSMTTTTKRPGTWSTQSTLAPVDGNLDGVSCASSSFCEAVGYDDTSSDSVLAETWNGTSWTVQSTPTPANDGEVSLNAVSCTSSRRTRSEAEARTGPWPAGGRRGITMGFGRPSWPAWLRRDSFGVRTPRALGSAVRRGGRPGGPSLFRSKTSPRERT
jgi:hypothetical protein